MTNLIISTTGAQEVTSPALEARNGHITATSLQVAEHFGKRHRDVLRAIRNLGCSAEFNERNFAPANHYGLLLLSLNLLQTIFVSAFRNLHM